MYRIGISGHRPHHPHHEDDTHDDRSNMAGQFRLKRM